RRSHDGGELGRGEGDRDPTQGLDRSVALPVDLPQVDRAGGDTGRGWRGNGHAGFLLLGSNGRTLHTLPNEGGDAVAHKRNERRGGRRTSGRVPGATGPRGESVAGGQVACRVRRTRARG